MRHSLKYLASFLLGTVFLPAAAQRHTFAIVIDSVSLSKCPEEVRAYADAVSAEGPEAVILSAVWSSPDQVRDTLKKFYLNNSLEGAVFIGDIPVPMIRRAQHLTSAFKMSEKYPMRDSSVPSDRFYDDFDLKFDFVCRDSVQTEFFYYNLSADSPQYIASDIYSARIRPSGIYGDKYAELSLYLRKVVRYKKLLASQPELCKADRITSYTGHGSFSNSLAAWKDETVTLSEQFPDAAKTTGDTRFYIYDMYPYMKDIMLSEISRADLDVVLFHEHGMPERQYLTGTPPAWDLEEYYTTGKYLARCAARTRIRYGDDRERAKAYVTEHYGVDSTWVSDAFDPEVMRADSLEDLRTGIVLDEIQKTAPNVRLAIFDACYNGDFREPDCVASRYVMAPGEAIAAVGNSVNVLQDKSSSDLLGMLAAGYSVGQWLQQVNILESHILGDPTFRFSSSFAFSSPDLSVRDDGYWLEYTSEQWPSEIRALALHKLYSLGYRGLSDLLLKTYRTSDSYMLRLQCFHLLAHYADGNYLKLLTLSSDDPYEFIRRKTAHYLGQTGTDEALDLLAKMYLNDINSKRVIFNVVFAAAHFPKERFISRLKDLVDSTAFVHNPEKFLEDASKAVESPSSLMQSSAGAITDSSLKPGRRLMYISGMRNNPYASCADGLLEIVSDKTLETSFRVSVAEVLGWYVRAWNRGHIVERLGEILSSDDQLPDELRTEIVKTMGRLNDYLR